MIVNTNSGYSSLGAIPGTVNTSRLLEPVSEEAKAIYRKYGGFTPNCKRVDNYGQEYCKPGVPAILCSGGGSVTDLLPAYAYNDGAKKWVQEWNAKSDERKAKIQHAWASGSNSARPVPLWVGKPDPPWRWCRTSGECIAIPDNLKQYVGATCTPQERALIDAHFPGGAGAEGIAPHKDTPEPVSYEQTPYEAPVLVEQQYGEPVEASNIPPPTGTTTEAPSGPVTATQEPDTVSKPVTQRPVTQPSAGTQPYIVPSGPQVQQIPSYAPGLLTEKVDVPGIEQDFPMWAIIAIAVAGVGYFMSGKRR